MKVKVLKFFTFILFFVGSVNSVKYSLATTLKEAMELAYRNSENVEMKSLLRDFGAIDRDTAWLNILPSASVSYQAGKMLNTNVQYGDSITSSMTEFVRENNLKFPTTGNDMSKKIGSTQLSAGATASLSYYM